MILNIRQRKKKAYLTALVIAKSYFWLKIIKPFLSQRKYQASLKKRHIKNANILKGSIITLNGLFIKVGQLLSILSNALPEAYGNVLESLQDRAPVSSEIDTEHIILEELGQSAYDIFDGFESKPIAAASIGQVHIAFLKKTGEKVAVKIQHPHIEALASLDLQIIENLVNLAGKYFKVNGLDNIYNQVQIMINEELDYAHEAHALIKIGQNLADNRQIIVPKVYTEFSTKKVLVTAYCEGEKITNKSLYGPKKLSAQATCEILMDAYSKMFLVDGYYHADPHPGNILVNSSGQIILLDFGAVGTLSDSTRKEIPKFLQAIVVQDADRMLASMQKMGFVGKGQDTERTAQKIIEAMNEFVNSGIKFSDIDFDTIKDSNIDELRKELSFKELTSTFDIPKDWILLQRSLVLLLAIFANIEPDYNPVDTIKPFVKKMILSKEGFKNLVVDNVVAQATTILGIPRKMDVFLTKANKGNLEIKVPELEKAMKKQNAVQILFLIGFIALICFIMSFISNEYGNVKYENYFTISSIGFGFVFGFLTLKYSTSRK